MTKLYHYDILWQLVIYFIFWYSIFSESHPDISHEKKCYPETLIVAVPSETSSSAVATETSSHAVDVTHCDCSLLTPCAELPKNVLKPLEECLNKPNEILENDWKRY